MLAFQDHYSTLGLAPSADDVVVHAAWRALLRKHHPDTSTAPDAEARTRDINRAYATLIDPQQRAAYDRSRTARTIGLPMLTLPERRHSRLRTLALVLAFALTPPATLYLFAPVTADRLQREAVAFAAQLPDQAQAWIAQINAGVLPRPA